MTKGPWANSVAADSQLSLPTAPESGECPYCGVILEFDGSARPKCWRQVHCARVSQILENQKLTSLRNHFFRDLEPFVCVIGNCTDSGPLKPGSSTFDTSRAWLSHMKNAHRYVWVCRAPSHEPIVFEDEAKYQEHIRTNPAVCEEHVVTMSVAAKKLRDEKITTCPFGDDFAASEVLDSDTVLSSEALQLHVATHLKEISLLALQKLPCDNDNNSREMASDLLSEVEEVSKLLNSMYTVLDDEAFDLVHQEDDETTMFFKEDTASSEEAIDLEDRDETEMTG
ncbi:hypothetical protein NHJ6243_001413 [Beauveria neobassiana]